MKQITVPNANAYIGGPSPSNPTAAGATVGYQSPLVVPTGELPTSKTSETSTALAPKAGATKLSTEVK